MKWWVWILLAGPVLAGGLEAVLAAAGLVAFILGALWVAENLGRSALHQRENFRKSGDSSSKVSP